MASRGIKQVFVSSLTEVFTTPKEELGTLRFEGNKVYKYVKYNDGAGNVAGVAGNTVVYYTNAGYGNNEVSMDTSVLTIAAGQLMAACVDGDYVWIQIRGEATHTTAFETSNDGTPVAVADGVTLVLGDADGALRGQNDVVDAAAERLPEIGIVTIAASKKFIANFPF